MYRCLCWQKTLCEWQRWKGIYYSDDTVPVTGRAGEKSHGLLISAVGVRQRDGPEGGEEIVTMSSKTSSRRLTPAH